MIREISQVFSCWPYSALRELPSDLGSFFQLKHSGTAGEVASSRQRAAGVLRTEVRHDRLVFATGVPPGRGRPFLCILSFGRDKKKGWRGAGCSARGLENIAFRIPENESCFREKSKCSKSPVPAGSQLEAGFLFPGRGGGGKPKA